jgi:hypothetical protein
VWVVFIWLAVLCVAAGCGARVDADARRWRVAAADQNTKRETGRKAQLSNIAAAKVSNACL